MRHFTLTIAAFVCFVLAFDVDAQKKGKRRSPQPRSAPTQRQQAQPQQKAVDYFQMASESVSKVVAGDLKDTVLCQIQAALWGNYDLVMRVYRTSDGKPHDFIINRGKFVDEIPAKYSYDSNTLAETLKITGSVFITSQEEAFKRGIPFYITNVRFEPPSTFRWTAVSNPQKPVGRALHRILFTWSGSTVSGGITRIIPDGGLSASSQPQEFSYSSKDFTDESWGKILISIVTIRGDDVLRALDTGGECLASNEVDLRPLKRQ